MTISLPSCTDGILNQDESDIDCGGKMCPKCDETKTCNVKSDCKTGYCILGSCSPSTICSDMVKDGDETDVDCGGPSCGGCGFGLSCAKPADCLSGVCTATHCAALKAALNAAKDVKLGMAPASLVAGDFDGDGNMDLAALSTAADGAFVALGKGDGSFAAPVTIKAAPMADSGDALAAGDLDGDGKADLVETNGGSVLVFISQSSGGMATFAKPASSTIGSGPGWPRLLDLDGDGKRDLVTADTAFDNNNNGYGINVSINAGGGTWKGARRLSTGKDIPTAPALGDFDGDGKIDLAAIFKNKVNATLGKGDGSFGAWVATATPTFTAFALASRGDFDPDYRIDLVALDRAVDFGIMTSTGAGMFARPLPAMDMNNPIAIVVADFDLDGMSDVAAAESSADTVSLYLGKGNRKLAPGPSVAGGVGISSLLIADFNRDGRIDLAGITGSADSVSVIINSSR